MDVAKFKGPACVLAAFSLLFLTGCETSSITKKIDYKSTASAPALELPPDLSAPQYDDRYDVKTASGLAATQLNRPRTSDTIAPNATQEARVVRGGTERWLVVKTTPELAWNTTTKFWADTGFVLALEQPNVGIMETDWAENRASLPADFGQSTVGKVADIFFNTYKRDKFRTRIERGNEPGTVEIYISHRGAEQVPTGKIDNSSPAAFVWAVMPPDPTLEAEMLTRLMMRFGTSETQARESVTAAAAPPPAQLKARLEKNSDGTSKLVVDDSFDRAWRRVGLALDRVGFTVVDRDRSKGNYFVRYSNPDTDGSKKEEGLFSKLMFWKTTTEKVEQYRITITEVDPKSVVTVQDPNGAPDKSQNGEKILALLKDQLQ
jgi:outer membrane protein assembly factor BamC